MNYAKVLLAGFLATGIMTGFMLLAPYIGLPNMNVGEILGAMFGRNVAVGWVIHFAAGIGFAFVYARFIDNWLPIESDIARGAVYGIFLAVATEVTFMLINFLGYLKWDQRESMALLFFGETFACIIYGAVLGFFVTKTQSTFLQDKPHTKPAIHH